MYLDDKCSKVEKKITRHENNGMIFPILVTDHINMLVSGYRHSTESGMKQLCNIVIFAKVKMHRYKKVHLNGYKLNHLVKKYNKPLENNRTTLTLNVEDLLQPSLSSQ